MPCPVQGVLRKGQEVEIRPGIVSKDGEGRTVCTPIFSRIMTLLAESNELQYAVPGGLIGVGTTVSWECGLEARTEGVHGSGEGGGLLHVGSVAACQPRPCRLKCCDSCGGLNVPHLCCTAPHVADPGVCAG